MTKPCLAPDKIDKFIKELEAGNEDVLKYIEEYDREKGSIVVRVCGQMPHSYIPVKVNLR